MAPNTDLMKFFEALTDRNPFPWQAQLYSMLRMGSTPAVTDIPTGLGKTSILHLWLIALAATANRKGGPAVPRRLVYIVNRRTVVDQASDEAREILERLESGDKKLAPLVAALRGLCASDDGPPLAVSTLRGQMADNGHWLDDPSRPAIVIGTVDMIGSRLLFSGYRLGWKRQPMHAGMLGHDTLFVHDEAHLSPVFQHLLEAIQTHQATESDALAGGRLRVMELTATSRQPGARFTITKEDEQNEVAKQRLRAKKRLRFHGVAPAQLASTIADKALEYKDSGQAILVYVQRLDDVAQIEKKLSTVTKTVWTLTGTQRGHERDRMVRQNAIFQRFLHEKDRNVDTRPAEGTVYLVCTSAGEVGLNISGDHLVCDLTPLDSMLQRFGRVNRFGAGDARIDIVYPTSRESSPWATACERTLSLLQRLPERAGGLDASPAALTKLDHGEKIAAFSPEPEHPMTTDILLDNWSLTTLRDMPGRPPVAPWLHGLEEDGRSETQVAWRDEVDMLADAGWQDDELDELLADYPLKPHELLRDSTDRVFKELKKIANRSPQTSVWVKVGAEGVKATTMARLVEEEKEALRDSIVILAPSVGGLKANGMLDGGHGAVEPGSEPKYDVADEWIGENDKKLRQRQFESSDSPQPPASGMRLVWEIDVHDDQDGTADTDLDNFDVSAIAVYWRWYVCEDAADDDGSSFALFDQPLAEHLARAEQAARCIVQGIAIPEPLASAIVLAAKYHDLGKDRRRWQIAVRNFKYPELILAKTKAGRRPEGLLHYRHEFGTLCELKEQDDFESLDEGLKELVRHLIAAHHGRARPCFPANECYDPEKTEAIATEMAQATPRRFARLQRRYGRWGLAWLESLVRAADVMASTEVKS